VGPNAKVGIVGEAVESEQSSRLNRVEQEEINNQHGGGGGKRGGANREGKRGSITRRTAEGNSLRAE